jgi:DNA repair ATPase RecN
MTPTIVTPEWGNFFVESLICFIAFIGAIIGIVLWITSRFEATHARITNVTEISKRDDESLALLESRARKDLADQIMSTIASLNRELSQMRDKSATREEMNSMENRLGQAISKLESVITAIGEKVGQIEVIKAQSVSNGEMLVRLLNRLDRVGER